MENRKEPCGGPLRLSFYTYIYMIIMAMMVVMNMMIRLMTMIVMITIVMMMQNPKQP